MRNPKSASTSTKPQQIRAVGYVRVSTEIQVSEGVSLETQRIKIRAHCIAHDIDLIEIISDDGVSAKSLDDPDSRERCGCSTRARRKRLSSSNWTD
jgi:hypothetical protein